MSLKNLIALQKGKPSDSTNPPAQSVRSETPAAGPQGNDSDANVTEPVSPVEGDAPAASLPATSDSNAGTGGADGGGGPKRVGLGLNVLKAGRAVGAVVPKPTGGGMDSKHGGASDSVNNAGTDDGTGFSLEDLAGFDASESSAPERPALSRFEDEIEATAPERALDPNLSVQQRGFIESLDGIYPVLHDPDLFGQAVRIIMLEMQEHPEYKKLIADQDVHTMIRGMRNTMGLASIRKQEKSRKAGGAGKKAARGKAAVSDEDMALLDNLLGGGSLD